MCSHEDVAAAIEGAVVAREIGIVPSTCQPISSGLETVIARAALEGLALQTLASTNQGSFTEEAKRCRGALA